jgi:hypothetical protein
MNYFDIDPDFHTSVKGEVLVNNYEASHWGPTLVSSHTLESFDESFEDFQDRVGHLRTTGQLGNQITIKILKAY